MKRLKLGRSPWDNHIGPYPHGTGISRIRRSDLADSFILYCEDKDAVIEAHRRNESFAMANDLRGRYRDVYLAWLTSRRLRGKL